ncbi:hypothetical protein BDA96_01G307200 [Sorghum bicolor]|uniref:Uncharacterized protein n=2 Tax=Sorghum bicolor TaxID=4558 RepID=A0A921UZC6_SORBI|nr:hypothetical protein BDA96_01G307200 [Sorghum bicolor]OQU85272.1 hypothetical protein SORBI_3004G209450 [Sorghum bicolor]
MHTIPGRQAPAVQNCPVPGVQCAVSCQNVGFYMFGSYYPGHLNNFEICAAGERVQNTGKKSAEYRRECTAARILKHF